MHEWTVVADYNCYGENIHRVCAVPNIDVARMVALEWSTKHRYVSFDVLLCGRVYEVWRNGERHDDHADFRTRKSWSPDRVLEDVYMDSALKIPALYDRIEARSE